LTSWRGSAVAASESVVTVLVVPATAVPQPPDVGLATPLEAEVPAGSVPMRLWSNFLQEVGGHYHSHLSIYNKKQTFSV
jgi:hypothetical protein